ncbi:hypothetical protein GGQ80_001640 [Sphingomonas jinjuensis]|uniref:Uncharacterized protein n=1 Tax=Sphingomonas jinjuensis TaxID=535907 RepID=A0A840FDA3_9SPHN|nr:hypothetical protein [Sphingomonas jinjuensis]
MDGAEHLVDRGRVRGIAFEGQQPRGGGLQQLARLLHEPFEKDGLHRTRSNPSAWPIDFIVCWAALDASSAPTLIYFEYFRDFFVADVASTIPPDSCDVTDAMRSAAFCWRAKVRALRFSASAVTRTARVAVSSSRTPFLAAEFMDERFASAVLI